MIILIDFENTHASGFQGVEYLNEQDTLVVYYSDENSAVNKGVVDDLKAKNVHVRMVKLLKQHSNALDMYIASTTGMFLDTGEKICIVSKDKGYAAVRDFWHSLRGAEILLGETIEECFLHSIANDDERIRRAKERSQKALLTEAFETMNNIPTRPTLSRNRFWRRGRQVNYDLSSHLNPVEILPNPLAKPSQEEEYTLTDNELENLKEFLEEENLIAKEDSVDVVEIESSPELDGENQNKTLAEKNVKQSFPEKVLLSEANLPSSINSIAEEEVKKEESSSMNGSVLLEELPKPETAQTFKAAPNQVRYVWDAVKKAMIKVEEELEGSLDQSSVGESTLLAEEENDITEGKKEKRRRNSRRRHSGKKTEEGTESKDSKEKIESKDNKEVSGEAELPLVPEKGAIEKKTKQSAPKDRKDKGGSSTGNNPEKPGLDKEDPKKEDPKEENPKKENLEKKDSKKEDPKKGNPKKENPKRENLKKKDSKKKDSEDKDSQNPEIVKKDMQTQGTKKDVEKRETEKTDNNIEVKKKSRRRPSRSRKKQVEEEVKEDSKENDSN
ncbi:hypothetical protein HMPREF9625_00325 [Oribacterium parvum ACB1]|uniref:PIN-like domain-containing protein n=2 Tax=Oribacterium parvum TaxID=1501329 RepID=G9WLW6_9FIRM|nr:PIN domain-containing protein [Oribacterium parvum]EHL12771.1 hypothetical protein HMPREF9625_00325 [Oribacterium parvum ACB1]